MRVPNPTVNAVHAWRREQSKHGHSGQVCHVSSHGRGQRRWTSHHVLVNVGYWSSSDRISCVTKKEAQRPQYTVMDRTKIVHRPFCQWQPYWSSCRPITLIHSHPNSGLNQRDRECRRHLHHGPSDDESSWSHCPDEEVEEESSN